MPLLHYNSRAANGSLFTRKWKKVKGPLDVTNFRVAKQLDLLNQKNEVSNAAYAAAGKAPLSLLLRLVGGAGTIIR
jgi:hypothetical protein